MPKLKNSNETFFQIFKQCVVSKPWPLISLQSVYLVCQEQTSGLDNNGFDHDCRYCDSFVQLDLDLGGNCLVLFHPWLQTLQRQVIIEVCHWLKPLRKVSIVITKPSPWMCMRCRSKYESGFSYFATSLWPLI